MRDVPEVSGTNVANQTMLLANADQREIELCREKKLAERELALIRTELRLLQEKAEYIRMRRVKFGGIFRRLSIIKITYLLGHFSGDTDDYKNWK